MYITQKNLGGGGRLGNQMFGLAALIGTAKKYNLIPSINDWEYSKYFKNPLPSDNLEPTHYYKEPYFHYTPINLDEAIEKTQTENKVYNLEGYFQSIKYWAASWEEIKKLFEPKMEYFVPENYCSIHVRRGDYVGNSYYTQLDMNYYEQAMWYMKEQTRIDKFVIYSDDINWCKSQFVGDEFEFMEGNKDIDDLFFMSNNDHNIIANSSFSFWASYLNSNPDKIVIAPSKDKWFGPNTVLNVDDLYLPNWILL